MTLVEEVKRFAKERCNRVLYLHSKDVARLALEIAEKEGANKEIVEIAAWLHDLGVMKNESILIDHHKHSVEIARKFLEDKTNKEKIDKVCKCIEQHMGPPNFFKTLLEKENKTMDFCPRPDNPESKVLYDADMINLISPFGVAKIITLESNLEEGFENSIDSIIKVTSWAFEDLKTKTGKELGKKYFEISKKFLERLKRQINS